MSIETDDKAIFCQVCKSDTSLEYCDDMGACPGNVFCGKCDHEIDMEGQPALLCGGCTSCKGFIKLDVFKKIQEQRKRIQFKSVVVA